MNKGRKRLRPLFIYPYHRTVICNSAPRSMIG